MKNPITSLMAADGPSQSNRSRDGHIYYLFRSTNPATPNIYKPGITGNLERRHKDHGEDRWQLVAHVELGPMRAWQFEQHILQTYDKCRLAGTSEILALSEELARQLVAAMYQRQTEILNERSAELMRRCERLREEAAKSQELATQHQAIAPEQPAPQAKPEALPVKERHQDAGDAYLRSRATPAPRPLPPIHQPRNLDRAQPAKAPRHQQPGAGHGPGLIVRPAKGCEVSPVATLMAWGFLLLFLTGQLFNPPVLVLFLVIGALAQLMYILMS